MAGILSLIGLAFLWFLVVYPEWRSKRRAKKQGLMVIVVFSSTESTIKFFSQAVAASKAKFGKALHLVFFTKLAKKTKEEADFVSDDIEKVLQWCQTVYERSQS